MTTFKDAENFPHSTSKTFKIYVPGRNHKVSMEVTNWKNVFATYIIDKKICRNSCISAIKMVDRLKGQEKAFHRKNTRISNNHIESLTLLLIRDIAILYILSLQIKRIHFSI